MLNNKKTFPLTLALLLSLGVYVEPTRAVNRQKLIVAPAQEKETKLLVPDSVNKDSLIKTSDRENVKQINQNLQQKLADNYPRTTVEITFTNSELEADTNTTEVAPASQNGAGKLLWLLFSLGLLIPLMVFLRQKWLSSKMATTEYNVSERDLAGIGVGSSSSFTESDPHGIATDIGKNAIGSKARRDTNANHFRRQSNLPKNPQVDDTVEAPNQIWYMNAKLDPPDVPNIDRATKGISNKLNKSDSSLNIPEAPSIDRKVETPNQIWYMDAELDPPDVPQPKEPLEKRRAKKGQNLNEQPTYILDPNQDQGQQLPAEIAQPMDSAAQRQTKKGQNLNEQPTYILDPNQDRA